MNISEQAIVFGYLQTRGYNLQKSEPESLKFAKDGTEIIILTGERPLPLKITTEKGTINYTAKDFNDLLDYLEERVK